MSVKIYMCVYCDNEVAGNTYCVPCHEYKSVVTKKEWIQFKSENPKTKNELYRIEKAIKLSGENLTAAYQSGDIKLIEAVLVNTLASLPSYLDAIRGQYDNAPIELAIILGDKVEAKWGQNGIAYLAARMSTICTEGQMQALIKDCSNA